MKSLAGGAKARGEIVSVDKTGTQKRLQNEGSFFPHQVFSSGQIKRQARVSQPDPFRKNGSMGGFIQRQITL